MQKKDEMDAEEVLATETSMDDTAEDEESPSSVYEIGYHFLPSLSEEGVVQAEKGLVELLKKQGAALVGDHAPAKIPLAYTLTKRVQGKILRFDEAYFGWVAFEMPRAALVAVKASLDADPSVLRYLIVRTSRDAVAATLAGQTGMTLQTVRPTGNLERPKREAEAGGEVSEVALDEALQTMATEDAKTAE